MRLSEIAQLTSAAITVQSMLRSWKCQKELMLRREQVEQAQAVLPTIKIQAFFRALQYRKVLSLRKRHTLEKDRQDEWHRRVHASGKIQAVVRSWLSRRKLTFAEVNAVKIQRNYRKFCPGLSSGANEMK
jgi:hypothetical protein